MSTELYFDRKIKTLEETLARLESEMVKFPTCVVRLIRDHDNSVIPTKAHGEEDACYDLYSVEELWLQPGHRKLIDTGLRIALEPNWEAQLRPRSGLSVTKGVTVLNSPATIDAGYRGPLKVNLINHGDFPVQILVGDRIAQMRLSKVPVVSLEVVTTFDETSRGSTGFGSSGR